MGNLGAISGYILMVVLGFLVLGFIARVAFKKYGKQYPFLKKVLKFSKRYHRFLGIVLIIAAPIHGYLALGRIMLHTGTLLYLSILVMLLIYILGRAKVLKNWIIFHRIWSLVVVVLFVVHYVYPWLI